MKKNTREFNSIRNFIVGLLNQILMLVLGLVSKNIFLKSLGTNYMGLNGLFTNIFMLLSFAEFGIGSVMVFSLYSPLARDSYGEISAVYDLFKRIYKKLSLIIMVIGLFVIPILPMIVNVEAGVDIGNIKVYYGLYLIGVVISNTYMYKSHMILADQKNYILSLFNMVFENGTALIQILILLKTGNYYLYLAAFIAKNAIYSLAVSIKTSSLYPYLNNKTTEHEINAEEKSLIFSKIRDVFGYKFARAFINGTDNIMISVLVGTIWVGYYSNYDLIIVGVTGLIGTFYDGISASIGDFIASEKTDSQYGIFETVQILNMWIAGFTVTCLFILFQDFIALWLGKSYVIDFRIVILIIFNYYLVCNRKAITIFREASGMFNKIKYAMFAAAVINILLSIVLGYFFGIYGVLLGTTIATLTTFYWYEPMLLMTGQFFVSIRPFIKLQAQNLIYACLSIALTGLAVLPIKTVSLTSFALKMVICLIVPNVFYVLVLSRKERFKSVLNIFTRYYKKIRRRLNLG